MASEFGWQCVFDESSPISVTRNSRVLRWQRFELRHRRLASTAWGASRLISCEIVMSRNRTILRKVVRRLVGLSVLVGVCAVVLPFPVTTDLPSETDGSKDRSQPFPCMNRPCGCRSADECWKKCCCFTNIQKVAWAKANGVAIPRFVITAAKKEEQGNSEICDSSTAVQPVRQLELPVERPRSAGSANKKSSPACCCKAQDEAVTPAATALAHDGRSSDGAYGPAWRWVSDVVAKHAASHPHCSKHLSKTKSKSPSCCSKNTSGRTKWVLALKAAECQGQSVFWLTLPPTVIPAWPVLPPNTLMIVDSLQIVSERLPVMSLRPPCPPPKIG